MKNTENKGIKNGSSAKGGTIRAFRSPYGSSGKSSSGERKLTSGRTADVRTEKSEAEAKRAEKAETVTSVKSPEPSPAPTGIKSAVEKRRGGKTAKATSGKRNSWRRASEVYGRDAEKKAADKKDKEKKAIPSSVRRAVNLNVRHSP